MTKTCELGAATLTGPHLSLIPFREEDICARYVGWLNDPEVNRFLEVRFHPQTPEMAQAFVRSFYGDVEKYMWGVSLNETRELVGTATLHTIDRHHGSAELGLMIGERTAQGKRTAVEVIELVLTFAFDMLRLRRITGGTYATNHPMNFTFKRVGFRCEAKCLQAYQVSPGTYVDGFRWALLVEEWQARRRHDA